MKLPCIRHQRKVRPHNHSTLAGLISSTRKLGKLCFKKGSTTMLKYKAGIVEGIYCCLLNNDIAVQGMKWMDVCVGTCMVLGALISL